MVSIRIRGLIMTTKEPTYGAVGALIWLGIAAVTVWALGKAIGWISSPIWVDMIPIFGGSQPLQGSAYWWGRVLQKPDVVISDAGGWKGEIKAIDKRLTVLEALRAET